MSTELTPLHPEAAIKIQRTTTSLSKTKPRHSWAQLLDSNDDRVRTATGYLAFKQLDGGLSTSNPMQDLPRQTGHRSETPPELLTETLGEAAFMKRCGQAYQVQVCPLLQALVGLYQLFCLPCVS